MALGRMIHVQLSVRPALGRPPWGPAAPTKKEGQSMFHALSEYQKGEPMLFMAATHGSET